MHAMTMAEVSVWARDLEGGNLPDVCAKSGKPALSTMRVTFLNSPNDAWRTLVPGRAARRVAVRGQIPFSAPYLLAIALSRLLLVAALVGVVYAIWQLNFSSDAGLIDWIVLAASAAYPYLYQTILRPQLEPTGTIFPDPSGAVWVRLRGVHPKFAATLEAARTPVAPPSDPILPPAFLKDVRN